MSRSVYVHMTLHNSRTLAAVTQTATQYDRLSNENLDEHLERAVHQGLIQVYDHADLPLVLGVHLGQQAVFILLRRHTENTHIICLVIWL